MTDKYKRCHKCGHIQQYIYKENGVEVCKVCKIELKKEEKKKVFTMIDSTKIFRG